MDEEVDAGMHRDATQPIPIFVLGSARSGTTWLSNLLGRHPDVSIVQHESHWGLVESRLYSCNLFAGDLTDDRRLIQFLEVFAASDLFRIAGGDKAAIYDDPPDSFYEIFFDLMDQYAISENAGYWVTKLEPGFLYRPSDLSAFLSQLDARYPTSKLVAIRRPFEDVLRSYLSMEGLRSIHELTGARRHMAIVLETARFAAHTREIARLVSARSGILVEYENLKTDSRNVLNRLGDFLQIDYSTVPDREFAPNSSFRTRLRGESLPGRTATFVQRTYLPFFQSVPAAAVALVKLRDWFRRDAAPLYWRLLRLEHMPQRFRRELDGTGQTALRELLFPTANTDE